MTTCICCNKRSRNIMGALCGTLKCKCKGVKCSHDGARVRSFTLRLVTEDKIFAKCDACGCFWTGHPDNSTLQSSFLCKYVQENMLDLVTV